jgi:hypothetical protein
MYRSSLDAVSNFVQHNEKRLRDTELAPRFKPSEGPTAVRLRHPQAAASVVKVFSGAVSDYFRKRKLLVVLGYALAAVSRPVFPLATTIGWVFGARSEACSVPPPRLLPAHHSRRLRHWGCSYTVLIHEPHYTARDGESAGGCGRYQRAAGGYE